MQRAYQYGASFNCQVEDGGEFEDIGGGGEGYTSLDFISNDLTKLKAAMLSDDLKWVDDHELVGKCTNNGGAIHSVMVEIDGGHVVAVLFEHPDSVPTIVE